MCAGAAVLARLERVVYGAHDPKAGAVGSLWDVVRDRRLNHRPEVVSGVRGRGVDGAARRVLRRAQRSQFRHSHSGCVRLLALRGENARVGGFRAGSAGVVAALTAFGALAAAAPAYADDTVTVQGTAFPDPARASLSFVGCDDLYQRTDEALAPMIGRRAGRGAVRRAEPRLRPGRRQRGRRAVHRRLDARDDHRQPRRQRGRSRHGRRVRRLPGARRRRHARCCGWAAPSWSRRVAPGRPSRRRPGAYTWTKYDMDTRQRGGAPAPGCATTVAGFAAAARRRRARRVHDRVRLRRHAVQHGRDAGRRARCGHDVRHRGAAHRGAPSRRSDRTREPATRSPSPGELRTGTGDPVPHATMILEQRRAGSRALDAGASSPRSGRTARRATVEPEGRTFYRWRFVDRPLAEGSVSMPLLLDVLPPLPTSRRRRPDAAVSRRTSRRPPTDPSSVGPVADVDRPRRRPVAASPDALRVAVVLGVAVGLRVAVRPRVRLGVAVLSPSSLVGSSDRHDR